MFSNVARTSGWWRESAAKTLAWRRSTWTSVLARTVAMRVPASSSSPVSPKVSPRCSVLSETSSPFAACFTTRAEP